MIPFITGIFVWQKKAYSSYHLDTVLLIPAYEPPHKIASGITDVTHRVAMVHLAAANYPWLEISDIEIKKKEKCFTVDTLRELQEECEVDDELFFIVGSDFVEAHTTWKEYDVLFELATFLIAARPGYSYTTLPEKSYLLTGEYPEISATDIRNRIAHSVSIDDIVPKNVCAYIDEHSLYREPTHTN